MYLASALAVLGFYVGLSLFPYASQLLFENYGYNKTMGILAGVESFLIIAGIFYQESNETEPGEGQQHDGPNGTHTNEGYVQSDEKIADQDDSSTQTEVQDDDIVVVVVVVDKFHTDETVQASHSLLKEIGNLLKSLKVIKM